MFQVKIMCFASCALVLICIIMHALLMIYSFIQFGRKGEEEI